MSRGLALILAIGAGTLVGTQAPINSRLARAVGGVQAATVSFLVGTAALVLVLAIARGDVGGFGGFAHVGRAPWWAFFGGLLGAAYVTVAIFAVRTLGATGLTVAVIGGQLAISVVIDRFGLLGIPQHSVGWQRILGLVLLAAGVALVVRR